MEVNKAKLLSTGTYGDGFSFAYEEFGSWGGVGWGVRVLDESILAGAFFSSLLKRRPFRTR